MTYLKRASRALAAAILASASGLAAGQAPTSPFVDVLEYFNSLTGHYLLVSSQQEIDALFAGGAGPGWGSTGYHFSAYAATTTDPVAASSVPVCRFYAPAPTNSHFYTADAPECEFLKTHDTGWRYEGVAFRIEVPRGGSCAANLTPVFRQYNNRARFLDSNHRFDYDDRVRAKMLARGWADEGVAFCTRLTLRDATFFDVLLASSKAPTTACGTSSISERCVQLTGLLDMTRQMWSAPPPTFKPPNPDYTPDFAAMTGWIANVDSVWSASFAGNPALHSFVEWVPGGQVIGVHLNGIDRQSGDYATISPTLRFGSVRDVGELHDVAYPWLDGGEHDVIVNFQLAIKTVRRVSGAQAYGGPVIEFVDRRSGLHFLVRSLAYGTVPQTDYIGPDPVTGLPMISTTFRDGAMFGRAVKGRYVACTANDSGGSCAPSGIDFSFYVDRDDFTKVIGLMRPLVPGLSPDVRDYAIATVQVRNETLGNAEVGLLENAVQFMVTR